MKAPDRNLTKEEQYDVLQAHYTDFKNLTWADFLSMPDKDVDDKVEEVKFIDIKKVGYVKLFYSTIFILPASVL
jgi:hypothetical protein